MLENISQVLLISNKKTPFLSKPQEPLLLGNNNSSRPSLDFSLNQIQVPRNKSLLGLKSFQEQILLSSFFLDRRKSHPSSQELVFSYMKSLFETISLGSETILWYSEQ